MASPLHEEILNQGVKVWNQWRKKNPKVTPDLKDVSFRTSAPSMLGVNLSHANLRKADLRGADFYRAWLVETDFRGARLEGAIFGEATLGGAKFNKCDIQNANFMKAHLFEADFKEANLGGTNFYGAFLEKAILKNQMLKGVCLESAHLKEALLTGTDLSCANLRGADFQGADLRRAILCNADMQGSRLVETKVEGADFRGALIHGISVWNVRIDNKTKQTDLIITQQDEPEITVDNLEMAQFIYLLLSSPKIGEAIETLGKKGVLIIGRFTPERKKILHAIRDELRRKYGFLPIMFDFKPLSTEPTIKTLSTLAHISRFVIADLTEAKSVLQELEKIVPALPSVPIQLLLHKSADMPPMSDVWGLRSSVLDPYRYSTKQKLLKDLSSEVIGPAKDYVEKVETQLKAYRKKLLRWQIQ